MNCLAVHLNPRLCRLCHQLALHSGLCLSRLRRPLLQLAARLLYLVAQALLQSTPLFSRHLRRQHAQGQVLDPTRHLRRHLRSHRSSGDKRGATGATGSIGGTRSLGSGYGICRGFTKLLLQSTAQRQHQLWRGSRKLVAQAALQTTPFPAWRRRVWRVMAQALLQSTPLFSTPVMAEPLLQSTASSRAWSIR